MVRADFITGLLLIALGLGALVESLRMPRFEEIGVNPYTVPGLVPGLLGAIIALLGLTLALRAARAGGWRMGPAVAALRRLPADAGARRLVLTLFLTIGYAGGLVGRVPFPLATALFAFAFILLFTPRDQWAARPAWRTVAVALAIAVVAAVSVTLLFERLFLVRLP